MNAEGSMDSFNGSPALIQASLWNVITDEEENTLRRMIKNIYTRFPEHNIKITIIVAERNERYE